jgi:hypothetical protein
VEELSDYSSLYISRQTVPNERYYLQLLLLLSSASAATSMLGTSLETALLSLPKPGSCEGPGWMLHPTFSHPLPTLQMKNLSGEQFPEGGPGVTKDLADCKTLKCEVNGSKQSALPLGLGRG